MKRLFVIPFILLFSISSCKKNDTTPPPVTGVTPAMARDSLYALMNQWYYWYNYMPAINRDNYSDPYKLLEAMRYKTLDKWSFVEDYDTFVAEMQGTFVGHGFRIGLDNQDNARIALIYNLSPLYAEGVRRGWIVKSINGTPVAPILKSGDSNAYSNLIGPSRAGITNVFLFGKPDNTETTITSAKTTFTINSVILYDTLHLSSGKITGHLVFDSFIQPSAQELTTAFDYFKSCNVEDLILDLRYNTGGYLYIAQELASYIAGNTIASNNSIFARLEYNDKNQGENFSYMFQSTTSPLSLNRLVVITSRLTASASEAVMNGLRPYMSIIGIGDTTYGKPVGMNGWEVGKKYFFWPVTFKMVNSSNQGDYYAGFPPAKVVADDITHDFSDRNELCLSESIHYLETGSVSAKKATIFYRNPGFSEKPAWMNNGFSIEKLKR